MASFLYRNKKHQFNLKNNSLVGIVGYSLTKSSLEDLSNSIAGFCLSESINHIVIGHSSSTWTKINAGTLANELIKLGSEITYPDKPCTLAELSWLITQSKTKRFGVYFTNSLYGDSQVSIRFFLPGGKEIDPKSFLKIIKTNYKFSVKDADNHNVEYKEKVDISAYPKYLKDKGIIDKIKNKSLVVDFMFGAAEYLIENTRKEFPFALKSFNRDSDLQRIRGYVSNPSLKHLQGYANKPGLEFDSMLIAFDSSGERFGLFDLKQKTAINLDSIVLLILNSLSPIVGQKVILSSSISEDVFLFAKRKGFDVLSSDMQLHEITDPILFYCDCFGEIYFNGYSNPVKILETIGNSCLDKSPGEFIDDFYSSLKKRVYCNAIIIYKEKEFLRNLFDSLKDDLPKASGKKEKHVYKLKSGKDRIFLFYDEVQEFGIAKLQSNSKDSLDTLMESIKKPIIESL